MDRCLNTFFADHPDAIGQGLIVAYSGGVDSVSLLSALASRGLNSLRAVHVMHNLRSADELRREGEIIRETCRGLHLPLTIATVKPGAILKLADKKKIGIEAAAREIRYGILKRSAKRFGMRLICTAHNADDQLETLISRFLSASSIDGLGGIQPLRDIGDGLLLIRPILSLSRRDIEQYAFSKKLAVSTDSTNASASFSRNRIRHAIMPTLDREFPGWKKGLLGTSRKLADDKHVLDEVLGKALDACQIDLEDKKASIDLGVFSSAPAAIRIRMLARCMPILGREGRLSWKALRSASESIAQGASAADVPGARIFISDGRLEIVPGLDFHGEDKYFFVISSEGIYRCGPTEITIGWDAPEAETKGCLIEGSFVFPLIVRSRKAGDVIRAVEGEKRLDDIMKSWHLDKGIRDMIPVIEDREGIVAVLPSSLEAAHSHNEKFRNYAGPQNGRRLYIRIKGA